MGAPKASRSETCASESTRTGSCSPASKQPTPRPSSCSPSTPTPEPPRAEPLLLAHAYAPSDVPLCEAFASECSIDEKSLPSRQMIVRMVRMLRLCDYDMETILQIMGLALVHLDAIFASCDARMEDAERACIAVLQCFNAHCYLMDEACPLKYWQQNIYKSHCTVRVLNAASMKLLKLLKLSLFANEAVIAAKVELLAQI